MAINKAVLAAMRAAGKVAPDIRQSYKAIRVAEDVIGAAGLVDPRCRIEDVSVQAPDGYAIPCRVFTPLDIDFSWREGFQVSEDFAGTILFFHGGGWANGDVDYYSDSCVRTAVRLARRVVSVEYRRSPEYQFPRQCSTATRWPANSLQARCCPTCARSALCCSATRLAATSLLQ